MLASHASAAGRDSTLAYEFLRQRGELGQIDTTTTTTVTTIKRVVHHVVRGGRTLVDSGSDVISEASRFMGGNPTGWRHNWCAVFADTILERTGHHTLGSARAADFASYGPHLSGPVPGSIAVMRHHVGFVEGVDARGNVIILSGNHQHRVGVGLYSPRQMIAYVMPR